MGEGEGGIGAGNRLWPDSGKLCMSGASGSCRSFLPGEWHLQQLVWGQSWLDLFGHLLSMVCAWLCGRLKAGLLGGVHSHLQLAREHSERGLRAAGRAWEHSGRAWEHSGRGPGSILGDGQGAFWERTGSILGDGRE